MKAQICSNNLFTITNLHNQANSKLIIYLANDKIFNNNSPKPNKSHSLSLELYSLALLLNSFAYYQKNSQITKIWNIPLMIRLISLKKAIIMLEVRSLSHHKPSLTFRTCKCKIREKVLMFLCIISH